MKMNYAKIQNNYQALNVIGRMVLPRKAAVAVARNISVLQREMELIEKQKNEIADSYAAKGEDGNFILNESTVLIGNQEQQIRQYTFENEEKERTFGREVEELNEVEVEVDILKIDDTVLDKCEESERYDILTPMQEAAIEFMIQY